MNTWYALERFLFARHPYIHLIISLVLPVTLVIYRCTDTSKYPTIHDASKYLAASVLTWCLWDLLWLYSQRGHNVQPIDFLAILGTVVTIFAWADAREQLKEITLIEKSLPTRYIQSFPNHLRDIIRLIENAKVSFVILTDCVDYGSFSNSEYYERVIESIETLHKRVGVKVEIRVCGPPQAISRCSEFRRHWEDSENNPHKWEKLLHSSRFHRRFSHFMARFGDRIKMNIDIESCKRDQFVEMMRRWHSIEATRLETADYEAKVNVYKNLQYMPGVFFWMRDGEDAIFVLSHTGSGKQGMAFQTHDERILNILKGVWKNVKSEGDRTDIIAKHFHEHQSLNDLLELVPNEKQALIRSYLEIIKRHTVN